MSFYGHLDYFAGVIVFTGLVVLMVLKRLPSPDSWEHFLASLNTKGGNIFILAVFTYVSLQQALRWSYHVVEMVKDKTLTDTNVHATTTEQFLMTTAFGMFAGALISTLTGIKTDTRKTDSQTVTVETKTAEVPK